jgi:hypothetical protein
MSIYDSLLASSQHGYDTINQNAMAQANMPTFADKFLAGLRGGQDQAYKQQMGMSQLQMNMAYKQAQEQRMREQSEMALLERQNQFLGTMSNQLEPSQYDSYVRGAQKLGIDPGLVPQQQFTQAREMEPAFPEGSLSEGGEVTSTPSEPVPFSGYGAKRGLELMKLTQNDQKAKEANALKIKIAASKPSQMENVGKLLTFAHENNIPIDHPIIQAQLEKYRHIQEPPPMGSPVSAVSTATGQPVLLQPNKSGGVREVEGYTPTPKTGPGARKPVNPDQLLALIDEAKQWVPKSSSGAIETGTTIGVSRGLGVSTEASQANARLKTISGWMTSNVPRMEGPQSDRDVQVYQEMAAKVADTTYPIGDRMAALDTCKAIMEKYAHLNPKPGTDPKAIYSGKTMGKEKFNRLSPTAQTAFTSGGGSVK